MQTTTNLSGRQLPPLVPHKRKQRDEVFDLLKPSKKQAKPMPKPVPYRAVAPTKPFKASSAHANMLLAGFMAHEFLTKGTLFGKLYDPTKADVPPASSAASSADFRTIKKPSRLEPESNPRGNKIRRLEPKPPHKNHKYVEVSELLKNGAHIRGIVNPSQLARLLHVEPDKK
ncbi:hypothetical protein QVD17_03120 [Tagetes erecta]|uniref:Uncharacterized protein n=1 Tax=Tagetes erecta TaxID=13708 RepID=A0AAD8P9H4_TARER|nr:hypothetical protein QVD17_03120 [Tagetes erecta]